MERRRRGGHAKGSKNVGGGIDAEDDCDDVDDDVAAAFAAFFACRRSSVGVYE